MSNPLVLAGLVAGLVWAALSYQQPQPEAGYAAALGSGGLMKVLAALVPAAVTFLAGSDKSLGGLLKTVAGLFVNVPGRAPTPAPGPGPLPVPAPTPGPVPRPGEALLALLLQWAGERLRAKDKAGADEAMALYAKVASEDAA